MKHFDALDPLRGLAAFSVFIGHLLFIYGVQRGVALNAVSDGTAAVDLFFVLSGFVLGLSLLKDDRYLPYTVKRLFRLYPPYWVAVAAGLVVAGSVPAKLIVQHLLMLSWWPYDTDAINNVIWTIVIELKISLLLPLLAWAATRIGAVKVLLASFVLALAGTRYAPLDFLRFLPLFAAGLTLAHHHRAAHAWIARQRWHVVVPLLLLGLALYLIRECVPGHGTGWKHFASAVGAVILLLMAVSVDWFRRALLLPPLIALGRISFSLYLFHLPLLAVIALPLRDRLGIPGAMLACAVIVVAVSSAAYRLIEQPSQLAGRRIAQRLL